MNDSNLITVSDKVDLQQELSASLLRHRLIAALLSANHTHVGVAEFRRILNEDYLEFANKETSLAEESAVLLELQDILKELEIISTYPEFHKKRTVAVAGGFSTGKSEFISSLFANKDIRLPIGLQPTTAIPTYAMSGTKENEVLGCSIKGGVVDLLEIDPDLQAKLSHDFIRSFGFNLKSIMPYIFLSTKMTYQNLCFIDTPGYNSSDIEGGHTDEDADTAQNFTQHAEAILWLIGADVNGTISNSDLQFLQSVVDEHKPLYIVLNKADLKPLEDIEDILDTIVEELDDYDIKIAGITAYSSTRKEEMAHRNKPLSKFLSQIDIPSNKHSEINKKLDRVENLYITAIKKKEKENRLIVSQLNSLKLDLLERDVLDENDAVSARINYIAALFSNEDTGLRLKAITNIMNNLRNAINQIFGGLPSHHDYQTKSQSKAFDVLNQLTNKMNKIKEKVSVDRAQTTNIMKDINSGIDIVENLISSFFTKK